MIEYRENTFYRNDELVEQDKQRNTKINRFTLRFWGKGSPNGKGYAPKRETKYKPTFPK